MQYMSVSVSSLLFCKSLKKIDLPFATEPFLVEIGWKRKFKLAKMMR